MGGHEEVTRVSDPDPEKEKFVRQALVEFEGPLIGYAANILHDVELARDVVQDTFLKLCKQEPEKFTTGLKAWLYTVCRNRALDVLRKNKRLVTVESEILESYQSAGPDPAEEQIQSEAGQEAMAMLRRLSDNQQEVIRLRFQSDLSYREISEVTGLSEGNVGFLLHTGLKKLRQFLGEPVA